MILVTVVNCPTRQKISLSGYEFTSGLDFALSR